MQKPENVREALERLLTYNDSLHNPGPEHQGDSGVVADSAKDIQDTNYEMLADMADLLGMEELYRADDSNETIVG